MRESRGRGACGSVGEEGSGPGGPLVPAEVAVAPVAWVFWTVAEPLVVVFCVGCDAGCEGPAAEDEDTPLVWDCDVDAIVAAGMRRE